LVLQAPDVLQVIVNYLWVCGFVWNTHQLRKGGADKSPGTDILTGALEVDFGTPRARLGRRQFTSALLETLHVFGTLVVALLDL
jgi:hypothetical protein